MTLNLTFIDKFKNNTELPWAQFYLEGQQTAVDLCGLNQSGAIIAVDIGAPLISSQVNQRKFAVQCGPAIIASQRNLEDGV